LGTEYPAVVEMGSDEMRESLIPSWEGWPKAGVGFFMYGPSAEPTPPLRGTKRKRVLQQNR